RAVAPTRAIDVSLIRVLTSGPSSSMVVTLQPFRRRQRDGAILNLSVMAPGRGVTDSVRGPADGVRGLVGRGESANAGRIRPQVRRTTEPLTRMPRRTVYCVIPRELAVELHDELREHWRDDPGVFVVVERRGAERR